MVCENFNFTIMTKLKVSWLILCILFLNSCATIFIKKDHKVNIYSNLDNAQVKIKDSTHNLPTTIRLKRSKQPLKVTLLDTNAFTKEYILKPRFDPIAFSGNIMFFFYVAPIGYLIDYKTENGFYYGNHIFLDKNDSTGIFRPSSIKEFPSKQAREYFHKSFPKQKKQPQTALEYFSKSFPTHKGQINWTISLPYVNNFHLKPQDETLKNNTGFWGIATGLEYFYKDNKFLNTSLSLNSDIFVPFPASPGYDSEYETMSSIYISLNDNFKIKRFSLGYGLNYSFNNWSLRNAGFDSIPPLREPITRISESIGLNANIYHQFGRKFFVGVIYRPTFFKISPKTRFEYEHLISFEFVWKIKLNFKDNHINNK